MGRYVGDATEWMIHFDRIPAVSGRNEQSHGVGEYQHARTFEVRMLMVATPRPFRVRRRARYLRDGALWIMGRFSVSWGASETPVASRICGAQR